MQSTQDEGTSLKIIILTGSELRHNFMRKAIALEPDFKILCSYCEGSERNISQAINPDEEGAEKQYRHLAARKESEEDFFRPFVRLAPDLSHPKSISKGTINDPENVEEIMDQNPDLIIAYGCSLIKGPLLNAFEGRFLNLHVDNESAACQESIQSADNQSPLLIAQFVDHWV